MRTHLKEETALSKYLLYESVVFVDRRLLLAALVDLGYTEVEEGEALSLYGYEGGATRSAEIMNVAWLRSSEG